MKSILLCSALFISILVYSQEISLEGTQMTMSTPTQTCAVFNTSGDLQLDAFGGGGEPGGVILIQDAGRVGVHTLIPLTPLHLKQLSGNSDGSKGFRIEDASGAHQWTIEIDEANPGLGDLDFYYNGVYKSSITTDGNYFDPTPLVGNSNNKNQFLKTNTGQGNGDESSETLKHTNLDFSKQVTFQQTQIDMLLERIELLEKVLKNENE